jgi:hypothetical protein
VFVDWGGLETARPDGKKTARSPCPWQELARVSCFTITFAACDALPLPDSARKHHINRHLSISTIYRGGYYVSNQDIIGAAQPAQDQQDDLLRPEPLAPSAGGERTSFALFCLAFAALGLLAIYVSSPVDLPEFPDCPIQTIGSCGHY